MTVKKHKRENSLLSLVTSWLDATMVKSYWECPWVLFAVCSSKNENNDAIYLSLVGRVLIIQ